jgi:hypothetical protein
MKVAIVVFLIGEVYIQSFNKLFRKSVEAYCKRHGYTLILQTELIQQEPSMDRKKFFWQRLLLPRKFSEYDYVLSLDSDIYIHANAPALPLDTIPAGKVAAINERKCFGNYEWREMIQARNGWERTGKDWYALSGETKPYNDHINGGFVLYQPQYHAQIFKDLYDAKIGEHMKYHQDDQSVLSSYLIDNDLIYWLDERFNRVWGFWKDIMYPRFDSFPPLIKQMYVRNCIDLNYFTHFTGHTDYEYIPT